MCAHHSSKKNNIWFSTPILYTVMILLGLFSGLSDIGILKTVGVFISDVFIRIFKCISLPIIALSIIVTLSGYRSDGLMKTVWRRTMCYTLGTTLVAAGISCLLYVLIQPSMVHSAILPEAKLPTEQMSYLQYVVNLIPSTILSPFIDQQVISVLFMGIVVGIAIRFIPEPEARQTITQFFRGAHGLLMVITNWVIAIIPLGLYGFITTTVIQFREGAAFKGIGEYLLIVVLANLV